jgi:maleylpyruvate isomerase
VTDALRWMADGTALLRGATDRLDDAALAEPSLLPGWSRRHVLAHVAANADALGRLARWASTGHKERMYASPQQRAAEIETGAALPAAELRRWADESAKLLAVQLAALSDAGWRAEVVTAQGRTVPATVIPWLRAREVMVHAVDLVAGVHFCDLPEDFLVRLIAEVVAKRAAGPGPATTLLALDTGQTWELTGTSDPATVSAPLGVLAAWLTGRPTALDAAAACRLPDLPPWL